MRTLYNLVLGGIALAAIISVLYCIGMLANIPVVEHVVGALFATVVLGIIANGLGGVINDLLSRWRNQ